MNVEIGNPAYKIYEGEPDDDAGELLDADFTLDPDKVETNVCPRSLEFSPIVKKNKRIVCFMNTFVIHELCDDIYNLDISATFCLSFSFTHVSYNLQLSCKDTKHVTHLTTSGTEECSPEDVSVYDPDLV